VNYRYFRLSVIPVILIIALIFYSKSIKHQKFIGFIYPLTALIIVINPISFILIRKLVDLDSYIRVLWIAFIPIIISLLITDIISSSIKKSYKAIFLIAISLSLLFTGKFAYLSGDFERAENPYKLSQSVIEATEAIVRDAKGKNIVILNNPDFAYHARQYDPSIKLVQAARPYFKLNSIASAGGALIHEINQESINLDRVSDHLIRLNINYLVISPGQVISHSENVLIRLVYLSSEYKVYQVSPT
jgi:hypothetical protein